MRATESAPEAGGIDYIDFRHWEQELGFRPPAEQLIVPGVSLEPHGSAAPGTVRPQGAGAESYAVAQAALAEFMHQSSVGKIVLSGGADLAIPPDRRPAVSVAEAMHQSQTAWPDDGTTACNTAPFFRYEHYITALDRDLVDPRGRLGIVAMYSELGAQLRAARKVMPDARLFGIPADPFYEPPSWLRTVRRHVLGIQPRSFYGGSAFAVQPPLHRPQARLRRLADQRVELDLYSLRDGDINRIRRACRNGRDMIARHHERSARRRAWLGGRLFDTMTADRG